jgi:hypothetical protein
VALMKNKMNILESFKYLEEYIVKEKYLGYDPFDALTSPLFRLPLLRSNKILRLGTQQVLKRLSINFRPLIGIKKSLNPVTIGLLIYAFSLSKLNFPDKKEYYDNIIDDLLLLLKENSSKGYSGICWGYNFDWEARYAKIPAYTPTIVATGIITNCLFESYKISNNVEMFEICKSACNFIINDLNRSYEGDTFCWSYSPFDKQKVYNATMKGARLLAQVNSIENQDEFVKISFQTVSFVINNQNENGSWGYAKGDTRTWSDSFHTGYILDCLDEYIKITNKSEYNNNLIIGLKYLINNFFDLQLHSKENMIIPKYYDNKIFPIDCTSAGQVVLTLCRFGQLEMAERVLKYMLKYMQSEKGYFYYQKNKFFTNKISYMRWSNAWMFLCIAYYIKNK